MTTVIPVVLMVLLGVFSIVMIFQGIDTLRGLKAHKKQTADMNRRAVLAFRKIHGYGVEVPIAHPHTAGRIFLSVLFLLSGIIGFVLASMLFITLL